MALLLLSGNYRQIARSHACLVSFSSAAKLRYSLILSWQGRATATDGAVGRELIPLIQIIHIIQTNRSAFTC